MKSNNFNPAIPAALIPFVAPMASFAAEGTGRVSSAFHMFCICNMRSITGELKYMAQQPQSPQSHTPISPNICNTKFYLTVFLTLQPCRLSELMTADSSGPLSFLLSLFSLYTSSGVRTKSPMTSSMATRSADRVKNSVYTPILKSPLPMLVPYKNVSNYQISAISNAAECCAPISPFYPQTVFFA